MNFPAKYIHLISIFSVLSFFCPGFSEDLNLGSYENMWIVVVGKFATYEAAVEENNFQKLDATILFSTYFSDLDPGWYLLIKGKYKSKDDALQQAEETVDINLVHYYVNYTGGLYNFDAHKYRQAVLGEKEYDMMQERIFRYMGKESPDSKRWVFFPVHEEDPEEYLLILTEQDTMSVSNIYVFADTTMIAWSPGSDKFAFIDYDVFYYGGAQQLYIVDAFTCKHIAVGLHDLIEEKNLGDRSKITVTDLAWFETGDAVIFTLEADYLGTSGDEMVDQHRIEELGDNFGKSDPRVIGDYVVYFDPLPKKF